MIKYECLNCGAESFSAADLISMVACHECGFDLQEVYRYLDGLRASGIINMLESPPYVEEEFEVKPSVAMSAVKSWINHMGKQKTRTISIDEILRRVGL